MFISLLKGTKSDCAGIDFTYIDFFARVEAVLLLARHSNQPASDMVKKTTLLDILGEKVYALTASVDACCVEVDILPHVSRINVS